MRLFTTLAAVGLSAILTGCYADSELCAEYTDPLHTKIEQLSFDLASSRASAARLSEQVARLQEQYETPETLSVDEVSREYPCLYVAGWNILSYYDEQQHSSPGIAYDFAIVPVLEDHGDMVKSFMRNNQDPNLVVVVWFRKGDLSPDYKQTAWYQSGLEGETAIALDNSEPFTCRQYK